MSDLEEFDINKHVLVRRNDNALYAIPLDRLEEFRLSNEQAMNLTTDAESMDTLVHTLGCYKGMNSVE